MARERGRHPTRVVIAAGLSAVLLAALLTVLTVGARTPDLAAAQRPAADLGDPVAVPVVTFVGDSWTRGTGATDRQGFTVRTAAKLGWEFTELGVGGSGYAQEGHGSTFDDRVKLATATHPDVLVLQGSLNDSRTAPGDLELATLRTMAHLRAAVDPETVVLIVGSSYTPGSDDAVIDRINATIAAAAERAGFRFVNPARQNWTDPELPGIWADRNHPNDRGYQLIADRLAPLLESLLEG